MSINKVILSGNVGNDPDVKTLESGKKLAKLSLATTDRNKDKTTQWHNLICWEKIAEVIEKYVKKGNYISVIGSISYREYEKDGVKKYFTEINVYEIELPPRRINEPEPQLDNNEGVYRGKQEVKSMSNANDLPGADNGFDPNETPPPL